MGAIVSLLRSVVARFDSAPQQHPRHPHPHDPDDDDDEQPNKHRPPSHIPIPPLPTFGTWSLTPSPSHRFNDPFAEPIPSPALHFYTAPSSPQVDPPLPHIPPSISPPLTTPPQEPRSQSPSEDESLASSDIDFQMDDQTLTALEKIYLFSQSKSTFHRVYIARSLPEYLELITSEEAIDYVLPLVRNLAIDPDEQVKLTLAAELATIVWWFYSRCQLVPESTDSTEESTHAASNSVSVAAFTPILGTFLLNPDSMLGGTARYAVVKLLSRMKKADDLSFPNRPPSPAPAVRYDELEQEDARDFYIGYFGPAQRALLKDEIIHQVVIGMGRLDDDDDDDSATLTPVTHDPPESSEPVVANGHSNHRSPDLQRDSINPYFPVYPSKQSASGSPERSQSLTSSPTSDVSTSSSETLPFTHSPNLALSAPPVLPWSKPSEGSPIMPLNSTLPHGSPRPRGRQLSPPPEMASLHGRNPSPDGMDLPLLLTNFQTEIAWSGLRGERMEERELDDDVEQASVGKYSSMSLVAAVTASGTAEGDTQEAFVKEVERVSKDPVTWVRREAAYALGALSKVVPEELVHCSLLPVFESLRIDAHSDVRHSALFALPAVLSRLTSPQRRALALETIVPLSIDESHDVRNAALEALGEVLYMFYADFDGPPLELLQLFLGRKQDRDVRNGQHEAQAPQNSHIIISDTGSGLQISTVKSPELQEINTSDPAELLELFYINPERPHIIAFNFPAVAMAIGAPRWHELREAYHDISTNRSLKVRKTVAASLGELARIIGPCNASRDLVPVWWNSVGCQDSEVRKKALDCLELFVKNLEKESSLQALQGVDNLWQARVLEAWRERESVAKGLAGLVQLEFLVPLVVKLFRRALDDNVAAVREAAISALPLIWSTLASRHFSVFMELRDDLQSLACAGVHRKRMTFIACQQALVDARTTATAATEAFLGDIQRLASDPVVGVRIGVARLVATMAGQLEQDEQEFSENLTNLLRLLQSDHSHHIQAYVAKFLHRTTPLEEAEGDSKSLSEPESETISESMVVPRPYRPPLRRIQNPAIFSRPPTLNTILHGRRPA